MGLVSRLLALAAATALLALAVDLAVSNPGPVEVRLWVLGSSGIELPAWLLVLASFIAGIVLGGVCMLAPLARGAWERRGLRARIRKLEAEAAAARPEDAPRLPGK